MPTETQPYYFVPDPDDSANVPLAEGTMPELQRLLAPGSYQAYEDLFSEGEPKPVTITIPDEPGPMSRSTVRLLTHPHHERVGENRATSDPVLWADFQTTMADCRAAVNIERGVPLDNIDPALGYRITPC